MPWTTPSLRDVRGLTRDFVLAALGATAMIPNSVLRIMSDAKAQLAHLTLLYIDWLSLQLLPDTAETEWLDRHGNIWLTNSDGSKGRKAATYASGSILMTGTPGIIAPVGTRLRGVSTALYETTEEGEIGLDGTGSAPIVALVAGVVGNATPGDVLAFEGGVSGINSNPVVVTLSGGTEEESDDSLRERVLFRIQRPPMGGDADDYIAWARAVPGVSRAWSYPNEMGIGTVTVRFMMDELRAGDLVVTTDTVTGGGYPQDADIQAVGSYIDTKRPVSVKDFFVVKPIPYFYNLTINGLEQDTATVRARIEAAIKAMEFRRVFPGSPMWRSWLDEAISSAVGEDHHELVFTTIVMPGAGYMATLGVVTYA